MNIPPPPPPPPPPLPLTTSLCPAEEKEEDSVPDDKAVIVCLRRRYYSFNDDGTDSNTYFYSYLKPTKSIIQDGPVCGLVALVMACRALLDTCLEVQDLLDSARRQGMTARGEMFSAQNLALLARELGPFSASVKDITDRESFLKHIASGNVAVVPYDADSNHEPCLRRGRSAHWAVVSGFCMESDRPLPLTVTPDPLMPRLYNLDAPAAQHAVGMTSSSKVFVWARQGKSRHLALWSLDALVSSNLNLSELSEKHRESDFVLPEGGMAVGLTGQVVLLAADLV